MFKNNKCCIYDNYVSNFGPKNVNITINNDDGKSIDSVKVNVNNTLIDENMKIRPNIDNNYKIVNNIEFVINECGLKIKNCYNNSNKFINEKGINIKNNYNIIKGDRWTISRNYNNIKVLNNIDNIYNDDINYDIDNKDNSKLGASDIEAWKKDEGKSNTDSNNILISNYDEIIEDVNKGNLFEINKRIREVKVDQVRLNVVVWNMQTLNVEEIENRAKRNFVIDVCAEIQPEIIFLIDVGKLGKDLNIPNYIKFYDGRNIIFKSAIIQDNVIYNEGRFHIPTLDLNFVYIRPNETNKELVSSVTEMLKKNYTVIGDMNLKTNQEIYELCKDKEMKGEMTMQTVIVKDKLRNVEVELVNGLSDHKLLIVNIERKVKHTGWKKLEKINLENTMEVINDILEKGSSTIRMQCKTVTRLKSYDNSKDVVQKILEAMLSNDMSFQYKIYERLWKCNKKEPFLGTWIPEEVKWSLEKHYHNIENKRYLNIPDIEIDYDLLHCKKKSWSKAGTAEGFILENIDNSLQMVWLNICDENKQESAIKNFFKVCNKLKNEMVYETFFLKKSKDTLKTVDDIRIISIVPIFIKIWESLIYDSVMRYISEYINKECKYQYGGIIAGSTFDAIFHCQEVYSETKSEGLIFMDISKGYDSVEWDILEKDYNELGDVKIINLLKVWLILVRNCNCKVNNGTIYKGRGLGMGLSLAPANFVFYVHQGLVRCKMGLKRITMYVDDLTIAISDDKEVLENVKECIEIFKDRGLLVNPKKCSILTNSDNIKNTYKDLNMEFCSREKYLGVNLRISTTNIIYADSRIYKFNKSNISIPKFVAIGLKRRIYEGAVFAKVRYSCMMIALRERVEKEYFWRNMMYIFKQDYYKLSYKQLFIILGNWIRMYFDMTDIKKIVEDTDAMEDSKDRKKYVSNYVKDRLKCGIKQLDECFEEFETEMDPLDLKLDIKKGEFNIENWKVSMTHLKKFVNRIYMDARSAVIWRWKENKIKDGIKFNELIWAWSRSRLLINFKVIQNIIFRHFPENYTWISFLLVIFSQINGRIIMEKDVMDKFVECKVFMWADGSKINIKRWMEIAYMKLDEYSNRILEYSSRAKIAYKQIATIFIMIDYISCNNIWRNKKVKDLIYILNLKLQMKDYCKDKYVELLEKEQDTFYVELDDNPVYWGPILSVDGSYVESSDSIGSGIYMNETIGRDTINNIGIPILKEEFKYIKVKSRYGLRNVEGEVNAMVRGLELVKEKGWKCVYIIFDYLGLMCWAKGIWSCNNDLAIRYKRAYDDLTKDIKIYWCKAKSHTNILYNEYADMLAKYGCGVEIKDGISQSFLEVGQSGRL